MISQNVLSIERVASIKATPLNNVPYYMPSRVETIRRNDKKETMRILEVRN